MIFLSRNLQIMKILLAFLFAAVTSTSSFAADLPCAQQMGQQRATQLANQCRQVSPATRPPCNAANRCAMIVDEVTRSCALLADRADGIPVCKPLERAGAFQGYLFSGGGTDATTVTVMTDKGERIRAYCNAPCAALFGEEDDHEVVALRTNLVGKRVAIDVAIERNAGRVPGPDDSDRIPLVKRIRLLD